MPERAHLSIGEVLSLLQDEFPDITISKIRFLESQGLLDPERTPSGYRKFYEPDIERLRWILHQQKENFLPLRVIKDRLVGDDEDQPQPMLVDRAEPAPAVRRVAERPATETAPESPAAPTMPVRVGTSAPRPAAARPTDGGQSRRGLDVGVSAVSLTRDELVATSGIGEKLLDELERYGLLSGRPMGRETIYDEEALVVARFAAGFHRFGVEARHLRMYKVSAEREAGFFEQVIMPLMKQRNPTARRQAVDNLSELTVLGEGLRAAMLRQALKGYLTS
jgi:DNA-binding transcriptional MerR regulator